MNELTEEGTIVDRILLLAAHQKEMGVVQQIVGACQAGDVEDQFARFRLLVRTTHVCIESLLAMMKVEALKACNIGEASLTAKQIDQLRGYRIDHSGIKKPMKLRFMKDARLSVGAYSDAYSPEKRLPGPPERAGRWSELRNRITHPKTVTDLHITSTDTLVASEVARWYSDLAGAAVNIERSRTMSAQQKSNEIVAEMMELKGKGELSNEALEEVKRRLMATLRR